MIPSVVRDSIVWHWLREALGGPLLSNEDYRRLVVHVPSMDVDYTVSASGWRGRVWDDRPPVRADGAAPEFEVDGGLDEVLADAADWARRDPDALFSVGSHFDVTGELGAPADAGALLRAVRGALRTRRADETLLITIFGLVGGPRIVDVAVRLGGVTVRWYAPATKVPTPDLDDAAALVVDTLAREGWAPGAAVAVRSWTWTSAPVWDPAPAAARFWADDATRAEFFAKTWAPARHVDWCLAHDECADLLV